MASIIKNTFYSSLSFGTRFLSNALLFILLARALGVSEFGRFAFALSFTGLFLVLIDYGFNLLVVREVSMFPQNTINIINQIITGKIFLILLSSCILFITIKLLHYPFETELLVYILWFAAIFYSFGFFFNAVFRGLNQFQYETYPTILSNILQCGMIIIFILLQLQSFVIAIGYLISRIIYFFHSFYLLKRKVGKPQFIFNLYTGLKVLRESFSFGIHAVLATLYLQLDTVFLSYYKGNTEVGYYQAAMRIVIASMILYEIIASSYFPLLAKKFKSDITGFKKDGLALNKYILLSGSFIATFLLLYPDVTIKLLYGKEYLPSILIIQLLAIVVFFRYVASSYAIFITIANSQKLRALSVAVSLIVNVVLNIVLIPRYGAIGAAVASVFTHVVLAASCIFFAIRVTGYKYLDLYCYKGLVILHLNIIVGLALRTSMPTLSAVLFLLSSVLILLVAFSEEEKRKVRYILNKITLRKASLEV